MSWIQEKNPEFDTRLYARLVDQIEEQRVSFEREQKKAIDIQREYETRRTNPSTRWAVGGWKASDLQLVTSSQTERVFSSGHDDDVKLFGGKP